MVANVGDPYKLNKGKQNNLLVKMFAVLAHGILGFEVTFITVLIYSSKTKVKYKVV